MQRRTDNVEFGPRLYGSKIHLLCRRSLKIKFMTSRTRGKLYIAEVNVESLYILTFRNISSPCIALGTRVIRITYR